MDQNIKTDQAQTSGANDDSAASGTAPADEEKLRQDLEQAQQKIQELTEMGKRALADLANYKKRVEEERAGFSKFAALSVILEILPVLDNFHLALAHMPPELQESEWVKGILGIEKQLSETIKKQGIEEMPSAVGQHFDPHKHEAVLQGPGEKDTVIEELNKGYMLGDKVIRPAKVKVGNGA